MRFPFQISFSIQSKRLENSIAIFHYSESRTETRELHRRTEGRTNLRRDLLLLIFGIDLLHCYHYRFFTPSNRNSGFNKYLRFNPQEKQQKKGKFSNKADRSLLQVVPMQGPSTLASIQVIGGLVIVIMLPLVSLTTQSASYVFTHFEISESTGITSSVYAVILSVLVSQLEHMRLEDYIEVQLLLLLEWQLKVQFFLAFIPKPKNHFREN